jgi:hypothetical protein
MFFNAWFVPYQKSSFSATALAEFARNAFRSSIAMESLGDSVLWTTFVFMGGPLTS